MGLLYHHREHREYLKWSLKLEAWSAVHLCFHSNRMYGNMINSYWNSNQTLSISISKHEELTFLCHESTVVIDDFMTRCNNFIAVEVLWVPQKRYYVNHDYFRAMRMSGMVACMVPSNHWDSILNVWNSWNLADKEGIEDNYTPNNSSADDHKNWRWF